MKRYQITFDGAIGNGCNFEGVKEKLSANFNKDIEAIERLFRGKPVVLKKDLEYDTALKYKEILEKSGALCNIVEMSSNNMKNAAATKKTLSGKALHGNLKKLKKKCRSCNYQMEALRRSCPRCGNDTDFSMDMKLLKEIEKIQTQSSQQIDNSEDLIEEERYFEAEIAIKKAIELNPFNEIAHGYMGALFFYQERYEEAVFWFEKSMKLNPYFKEFLDLLAEAKSETRKLEKKKIMDQLEAMGSKGEKLQLIWALGDENESVRDDAAQKLSSLGEPIWAEYVDGSGDDLTKLGESGDTRAIPALVNGLLYSSKSFMRNRAAKGMEQLARKAAPLRNSNALKALVKALEDRAGDTNWYAVCALGEMGDPRAAEALYQSIVNIAATYRKDVFSALAKLEGKAGEPYLRAFLARNDWEWAQDMAAQTLRDMGEDPGGDIELRTKRFGICEKCGVPYDSRRNLEYFRKHAGGDRYKQADVWVTEVFCPRCGVVKESDRVDAMKRVEKKTIW